MEKNLPDNQVEKKEITIDTNGDSFVRHSKKLKLTDYIVKGKKKNNEKIPPFHTNNISTGHLLKVIQSNASLEIYYNFEGVIMFNYTINI